MTKVIASVRALHNTASVLYRFNSPNITLCNETNLVINQIS